MPTTTISSTRIPLVMPPPNLNAVTSTAAAYPDREIQGRMRRLKETLARRFAAMEAAFEDESN